MLCADVVEPTSVYGFYPSISLLRSTDCHRQSSDACVGIGVYYMLCSMVRACIETRSEYASLKCVLTRIVSDSILPHSVITFLCHPRAQCHIAPAALLQTFTALPSKYSLYN